MKIVQKSSARLATHESLVVVLDTVAVLSGICEQLPLRALPDASRPDVLRLDRRRNIFFIGDAKNSETPGNRATQLRLHRYLQWLAAFIHGGGSGVFILGFEGNTSTAEWINTVLMLVNEVSMRSPNYDVGCFPPDIKLVRFLWRSLF